MYLNIAEFYVLFAAISIFTLPTIQQCPETKFPFENSKKPLIDDVPVPSQLLSEFRQYAQDTTSRYYPAVTSILTATMSPLARRALERWRKNKIASLGMDGFLALNKATLQKGKDFHFAIKEALTKKQNSGTSPDIVNCLKSVESILGQISKVHVIEGEVVHQTLKYRGYVDCICDMGGAQHVAIEWKKSERKKTNIELTYDAPLQLVAYMGAANYDSLYNYQITKGAVVVVNEDGSPANVFQISEDMVQEYWTQWYKRFQMFNEEEKNL